MKEAMALVAEKKCNLYFSQQTRRTRRRRLAPLISGLSQQMPPKVTKSSVEPHQKTQHAFHVTFQSRTKITDSPTSASAAALASVVASEDDSISRMNREMPPPWLSLSVVTKGCVSRFQKRCVEYESSHHFLGFLEKESDYQSMHSS